MKDLSKEERLLTIIIQIYYFSAGLSGIFLQIFFFKLGGFSSVFYYNLITFTLIVLTYIISGKLLKKYTTKHLINWGLILALLSWLIILVLGVKAINHLLIIGIITGIAGGLFWSGFNLSQYILSHKDRRHQYFGTNNLINGLVSIASPVIAGYIILFGQKYLNSLYQGYYLLFSLILILYLIIIFFALQLPSHSGINFSNKDIFKFHNNSSWRYVLGHQFFTGLFDASVSVIWGLILLSILITEKDIGVARMITNLILAVMSYFAGKQLAKNQQLFKIGVWGNFLGLLILGLFNTLAGLIASIVILGISLPFLQITTSAAIYKGLDEDKSSWQSKYHYLIQRDAALGFARVLSFLILFIIARVTKLSNISSIWLIIISFGPLVVGYLINKQYRYKKSLTN